MAGAAVGLEVRPEEAPRARFRARTYRLIASRWPTVGVFDGVASADDLEAALVLESLTNDRVSETLTRLGRLNRSEWVTRPAGRHTHHGRVLPPGPGRRTVQ
jgi:hypothetical protein